MLNSVGQYFAKFQKPDQFSNVVCALNSYLFVVLLLSDYFSKCYDNRMLERSVVLCIHGQIVNAENWEKNKS